MQGYFGGLNAGLQVLAQCGIIVTHESISGETNSDRRELIGITYSGARSGRHYVLVSRSNIWAVYLVSQRLSDDTD